MTSRIVFYFFTHIKGYIKFIRHPQLRGGLKLQLSYMEKETYAQHGIVQHESLNLLIATIENAHTL